MPKGQKKEDKKVKDNPSENIDVKTVEKPVESVENVPADFIKRLERLEAENKKLLEVADKARLARVEAKDNQGAILIRKVKVSRFGQGGPIIKSWDLLINEAYAMKGQILEKQSVELTFENGDKKVVDLVDFYRMQNKDTIGEIKKRSKDEITGEEILFLELLDGKELEIGLAYVN